MPEGARKHALGVQALRAIRAEGAQGLPAAQTAQRWQTAVAVVRRVQKGVYPSAAMKEALAQEAQAGLCLQAAPLPRGRRTRLTARALRAIRAEGAQGVSAAQTAARWQTTAAVVRRVRRGVYASAAMKEALAQEAAAAARPLH